MSDAGGEEALEIHTRDGSAEPVRLEGLDIGRPRGLDVSPKSDKILLTNHRNELFVIDLETRAMTTLANSKHGRIAGMSWSPDGRWAAYAFWSTQRTCQIYIADVASGESHRVTHREFFDFAPSWDPEGKYLYFLSAREYNPVYDSLHFDLSFPQSVRPLVIPLKKDTPDPFVPLPRPIEEKEDGDKEDGDKKSAEETEAADAKEDAKERKDKKEVVVEIDFEGIERRVIVFPFAEGRYGQIAAIKGKVLFTTYPVRGSVPSPAEDRSESGGALHVYDFKAQKRETLVEGIDGFDLSRDGQTLIYNAKNRLRVVKAGEKPPEKEDGANRRGGWLDLGRVRCAVEPLSEWRQMYREAWRLQRDYFWTEDMSGVDWGLVYNRYLPLVERVGSRTELGDLIWEMQGELGTSHAYEMGGDYRPGPNYPLGFLGADVSYDADGDGFRIDRIVQGDAWEETKDSALNRPAVNVVEGDVILSIAGERVEANRSPNEYLVNRPSSGGTGSRAL